MAISEPYTDSATIGTAEYSCPNDSTSLTPITDDGVYQVFLDLSAMEAGDQFQIRIYEKVRSASTQRVVYESVITGLMAPVWVSPSLLLLHGWDVTLKKLAGSDRSLEWSIRKVA
jgi:hypothetical protein